MKNLYKILALSFALLASSVTAPDAGAQTDSLYLDLESTTFVSQRHSSAIKAVDGSSLKVDIDMIQSLPKILGNTDPVNFIRNLPGVQTSSEYDSGIHVNGCDNSHNSITIGNVPLFSVNHLFGFFSVFNSTHYDRMRFSTSAKSTNRIGGELVMELPDTLSRKVTGDINVGMMSTQGTLGLRIGRHSHMRLSARQSYMNLLYGRWLQISGSPIRYGFGDYNFSWLYAKDRDRIWVDAYLGNDKANIIESNYSVALHADWGNSMGAIHWEHKGNGLRHRHSLHYSGYRSNSGVSQYDSRIDLDSYIRNYGYRSDFYWKDFIFDLEASWYDVLPQTPSLDGLYGSGNQTEERQDGLEASAGAEYRKTFGYSWDVEAALKGNMYISPEREVFWSASPRASVTYNAYQAGKVTASYRLSRQHLFQTGLSNIGLPFEFWLMAGKHSKPQMSHDLELSYKGEFFNDAIAVSASAYYKQMYNQVEYHGDVMDLFTTVYDLDSHLLKGRGWNYGLNMMVHKQTGDFTGWVSYSLGRALRKFDHPDHTGIYPANHERIHELNVVGTYKVGRWDFAGTFVCASGTPFTAPDYYYLSSGQIITQYGEHNACRMRPYIRLDISASYSIIKDERQENGINVSLYNITARENDVMYRMFINDGTYSYGPMSFFLKVVPSVSYYHKF